MISQSDDPWIIPSPEQIDFFGDSKSLILIEIDYCELISASKPLPPDHAPLGVSLDTYSQSPSSIPGVLSHTKSSLLA